MGTDVAHEVDEVDVSPTDADCCGHELEKVRSHSVQTSPYRDPPNVDVAAGMP